MFKLNLCAKATPEECGEYYVVLFDNEPNGLDECTSQIIDDKSQIVYSYNCEDFGFLTEKLYERIKLLGNDVKCVDNLEELKDLPAKQFAQLINEYDADEVLLFMKIIGSYISLKTIASSN
jgi:hypothetical protein